MSLAGLLNQTLTRYGKSSYDSYGREQLGSGSSVKCRFQAKTIRRLLPNGNYLTVDALAYVPSDTTIATDDKVTIDSVNYKVLNIYPVPDRVGNVHHKRLELMKWL